jgi:hypothetical protein
MQSVEAGAGLATFRAADAFVAERDDHIPVMGWAASASSRSWLATVCSPVLTRRYNPTRIPCSPIQITFGCCMGRCAIGEGPIYGRFRGAVSETLSVWAGSC